MPRPLTRPTSTPFGAVTRDSMNAVMKPMRPVESLWSSTIRESTPSPPTTTTGPSPLGASRPGRDTPTMSFNVPSPMLTTSLPAPPSTRTGTVAAVLATVMASLPALPWTWSWMTFWSAAGASYFTC